MEKSGSKRIPISPRLTQTKSGTRTPSKFGKTLLTLSGQRIKQFHANQMSQTPKNSVDVSTVSSANASYIDLSNNKLTVESLQKINESVSLLNLSRNPLLTCKIPVFEKLRSLYLDDCQIESFEGLPSLPNLRILSIANNYIESFNGLRMQPQLTSINLSGNSVDFDIRMVIAAFGSIHIAQYNRQAIDQEDIREAFSMSPLIGHSLRMGRDPVPRDSYEEELRDTRLFLAQADTSLVISHDEKEPNKHRIVCPFDTKKIKWYKNAGPDNASEWELLKSKNNARILPLDVSLRLHLIRCECEVNGRICNVYTDEPFGREENELNLPYPIQPAIAGTPVQGSMVTIMMLPLPARIAWSNGCDIIAQETSSILITEKEVNEQVFCFIQPYPPKYPELSFSTVCVATSKIAPLIPTVGNLEFPENLMELEEIVFHADFFPNCEGESQILVERAQSPSSEWVMAAQLEAKNLRYTPVADDVNYYLRLNYTPVTTEGIYGSPVFVYSSSKVRPAFPKFTNPRIGGLPKTHHMLVAFGDYSGGVKGDCIYDWYFSKQYIKQSLGVTPKLKRVASNKQYFAPRESMAEGYLAVQMTPVRNDDVVGDPVFCVLDQPLSLEDPPKLLDTPSEIVIGKRISFSEKVDILLSNTTGFCGFDFLKSSTEYRPREKHRGRIVKIVNESVDMILGEVTAPPPTILDVDITCPDWTPGSIVSLAVSHRNVRPDGITITWVRTNGNYKRVVELDTPEYKLTHNDVGCKIQAIATALDDDGKRLEPVCSGFSPVIRSESMCEPTISGKLCEGFCITISCDKNIDNVIWYHSTGRNKYVQIGEGPEYILQREDVSKYIKAEIILLNGQTLTATTRGTVEPCDPSVEIVLPDRVVEGEAIIPKKVYHGGSEGESLIEWYRHLDTTCALVGTGFKYVPTADDVDCYLEMKYIPVRNDGQCGKEVLCTCGPVDSGIPKVKKVKLVQNDRGLLEVTGQYFGGYEGESRFIWRIHNADGTSTIYGQTVDREIAPNADLVGATIDVLYVPVRIDGGAGEKVCSNKLVVQALPHVVNAEILVKHGKIVEGNPMRCRAVVSDGAKPRYQWYHGDGEAWEMIDGATKVEYTPTTDDIGFNILCYVTAVNSHGWKSSQFSAATNAPVESGEARLLLAGDVKNVFTGMVISTTIEDPNELSKAELVWQRNTASGWVDIAAGDSYIVSVADVGHRLRAITAQGIPSNATGIVQLDSTIASYARALIKTKAVKFTGESKIGTAVWTVSVSSDGITMENKKNKKVSKWNLIKIEAIDGTSDEMAIWMDPASKFVVIPSLCDKRLEVLVGEMSRDLLVTVINAIKGSHI